MISSTKIDGSFPVGNFSMVCFSSPYRSDWDSIGGGISLYVREDIPSNLLSIETKPIEGFYVEQNLRDDKQLINCSYNPHRKMRGNQLQALSENIDSYSSTYDKFIVLGDFNVEMVEFRDNYSLRSLINQQTCYKSPTNPKGVDLILTCRPQSFQCTCVLETGLSEFH